MKKEVTLRGIIIPIDWDASGDVSRLAIQTTDEKEFELAYCGREDLRNYLRQEVLLSGTVKISQSVKVKTLSLVK